MGTGCACSSRLVDPVDYVLGISDSGEDEVVVVACCRVEIDVADLHQALVDGLLVVDVLDSLEAGLLDLAGDDAAANVEAAVGDRVGGRDSLDKAGHDGDSDDRRCDQDRGGGLVHEAGDDRDDHRDDDPGQVEAEDRPPGWVPLIDHGLTGLQLH